jgi:hypothetical protein
MVSDQKRLDWPSDILQVQRAELLELQTEPTMHVVADRSRDTDATGRALRLKPCDHIHRVAVQISAISNRIAEIDADAEPDRPIWELVVVVARHLLLHLETAAHCAVNAVEHNEQGVTAGLDDPPAMLRDSWVDYISA